MFPLTEGNDIHGDKKDRHRKGAESRLVINTEQ